MQEKQWKSHQLEANRWRFNTSVSVVVSSTFVSFSLLINIFLWRFDQHERKFKTFVAIFTEKHILKLRWQHEVNETFTLLEEIM